MTGAATGGERTAGFITGLLGLLLAGVLLAAVNLYVLILIIPAAHAWLWVASASRGGRQAMAIPYESAFSAYRRRRSSCGTDRASASRLRRGASRWPPADI